MSTAGPHPTASTESLCPGVPYPGAGLSFRCLFPIGARGIGGSRDTGGGRSFGGQRRRRRCVGERTLTAIFDCFFPCLLPSSDLGLIQKQSDIDNVIVRRGSVPRRGKKADVSVSGDEMRTLVKMKHGDDEIRLVRDRGWQPARGRMKPCQNRTKYWARILGEQDAHNAP